MKTSGSPIRWAAEIERPALGLPSAHDAATDKRPVCFVNNGPLVLRPVIAVKVDDDPVIYAPELMGKRRVGEHHRKNPSVGFMVQYGQPGFALGIEAFRSDRAQFAGGSTLAVDPINVKKLGHRRLLETGRRRWSPA